MKKRSVVLGLVAGAMIVLNSGMHSLLGWMGLSRELAAAGLSSELMMGVFIGWHFGGAAMLTMGLIVVATFLRGRRGPVWLFPARIIAAFHLTFGIAACLISGGEIFFLIVSVIPGALLAAASLDR
jgi:hypothetical protein